MFGQFKSSITLNRVSLPCRTILLPPPPTNVNDPFLASYFRLSRKETTAGNMHRRWIHAACTLLKKGRLSKITDPVTILAYYINSTSNFFTDTQMSDMLTALDYEVVDRRSQIKSLLVHNKTVANKDLMIINVINNIDLPLKDLDLDDDTIKNLATS